MALQDVLNKIQISSNGPPGSDNSFQIKATAVLTNLYENGGAEARQMLDGIASSSRNYLIQFTDNNARADIGVNNENGLDTHVVSIDFEWVEQEFLFIDQNGVAKNISSESVLAHELAHLHFGTDTVANDDDLSVGRVFGSKGSVN